ncbi:hypothetical protein [Mycolicibacterium fortuitum]|jgi:hypothetical protein|uniref:hypothetical protein n=1 Tax=Mycolicibacterium fortuitum TaxID=1766 RepID=UPI003AACFCCB
MSSLPPDPFGPASATGGAPQSWPQQPGGHGGALPERGPGWGPQQQSAGGPPRPSNGGGKVKWLVGGLAVVLAIALVVVITVLVVKPDTGTPTGPSNPGGDGSASEFASANDTGPITIITEDPSCAAWAPIQSTLAEVSHKGWSDRDPSIPASVWNADQRAQYQAVAAAMRSAADQTVALVKLARHRAMRELYEQFITYARAYADTIPTYTAADDSFALTANTITGALDSICAAIGYGSAAARAPLVAGGELPVEVGIEPELSNPSRFMTSPDPICPDWKTALDQFAAQTAAWSEMKSDIPASQWSPEEKGIVDAVQPLMHESADMLEGLGRRSENATVQDFATLAAQYRRAYALSLPSYRPADKYLAVAALRATGVILGACKASET